MKRLLRRWLLPPADLNLREFLWGIVASVLIIGALYWYFAVYDTAAGKCHRGDLGACVVVTTQQ